jgi:hypothetical protein
MNRVREYKVYICDECIENAKALQTVVGEQKFQLKKCTHPGCLFYIEPEAEKEKPLNELLTIFHQIHLQFLVSKIKEDNS